MPDLTIIITITIYSEIDKGIIFFKQAKFSLV